MSNEGILIQSASTGTHVPLERTLTASELLEENVTACLRHHPRKSSFRDVVVVVEDGKTVVLRGTVGLFFVKSCAQEAVKQVMGVERVKNEIQVV